MKRILLALLLSLLSLNALAELSELSDSEVKTLIDKGVTVIDVRTADEWQETGVIKGSHLITYYSSDGKFDTDAWLKELSKVAEPDEPIILVCRSGRRSSEVGRLLDSKLGYKNVSHMKGGIVDWIKDGNPTVTVE